MSRGHKAELIRVIDGDTIVFNVFLAFNLKRETKIRLLGVDTAETYGVAEDSKEYKLGKKHERFVEQWLTDANDLRVRIDEQGKFGRWLGEVFNGHGESLNDRLLEEFDIEYE